MYSLKRIFNIDEAKDLLLESGLDVPQNTDYTVGLYDAKKLIAVGSLSGNVIMGLATSPLYRGEGLIGTIISDLIDKASERNIYDLLLFTKPENAPQMENLGFCTIGSGNNCVILMERGPNGIEKYKKELMKEKFPAGQSGAIVMNLNPLTNGHLYLISKALENCDALYIFVVEEDRSVFPFKARIEILQETLNNHPKIKILASGRYIISGATFPSYFLKQADLAPAQAALDIDIFARHIAPTLGIVKRFAGHEPFCSLTSIYNDFMRKILPEAGIEFCEIERLAKDGQYISASAVRKLVEENRFDEIKDMVPTPTFAYIMKTCAHFQG
ncbi:MAG: [citrate (pro-3S)-lyase] ligase [Bacillota bacterium]|jgi:[citrate (pro-3S)-lyase] ligase